MAVFRGLVAAALAAGLGLVCAGCGGQEGRVPLAGTVVGPGGEKFSGSVSFLPPAGASGPAATASLVDGQYRFDASDGPTPGPHRVVVTRSVPKGAVMQAVTGQGASGVPPKMRWTLSIDVPDKPPYQCDLKLD